MGRRGRILFRPDTIPAADFTETAQGDRGPVLCLFFRTIERSDRKLKKTIDELIQEPYWIIDILPEQVPKDSPGQFFAVEKYFLTEEQLTAIKQKHINLILKLNCYMDIYTDNGATCNPPPDRIDEEMRDRYMYIIMDDGMILSEPDDTHMTLFSPDERLLNLVREIAGAEGLFVWGPLQ